MTVRPSARPDADHLATHARTIDRLYEQLMYWTSPTLLAGFHLCLDRPRMLSVPAREPAPLAAAKDGVCVALFQT